MQSTRPPTTQTEPAGCRGLLARLFWMFAGNIALVVLALAIGKTGAFSLLDPAYAALVLALAAVRWVDVHRLGGQTQDGVPATPGDWKRYVVVLALAAIAIWAAAHALGRLFAAPVAGVVEP